MTEVGGVITQASRNTYDEVVYLAMLSQHQVDLEWGIGNNADVIGA